MQEPSDYDLFDYKHVDEQPLSLDEAIKKASALRTTDPSYFHRITATDSSMTGFRIESVSREEVYVDRIGRAYSLLARFKAKWQRLTDYVDTAD